MRRSPPGLTRCATVRPSTMISRLTDTFKTRSSSQQSYQRRKTKSYLTKMDPGIQFQKMKKKKEKKKNAVVIDFSDDDDETPAAPKPAADADAAPAPPPVDLPVLPPPPPAEIECIDIE